MNLGPLQSHAVSPPSIGSVDAATARSHAGAGPLEAISGNTLIGLDVWGGVSASGRSLAATDVLPGSASGDIEQTVGHILAPLR